MILLDTESLYWNLKDEFYRERMKDHLKVFPMILEIGRVTKKSLFTIHV